MKPACRMGTALPLAFVLLLGACGASRGAKSSSDVEVGMFLPLGAQVAEDQDHLKVLAPGELSTPAPTFPFVVEGDVDITICAEIVVSTDGGVASVRQIAGNPGCIGVGLPAGAPFFGATEATLKQWQFFAGGICRYEVSEDECASGTAHIDRRAMKLAYFFRFTRTGGIESVTGPTDRLQP